MSDDTIFREVDEAVRQDQLKKLWERYGVFVVAAALLIVVAVAGYKGWIYWRAQQASEAGARFSGALQLAEEGKAEEARAAFEALAASGPAGYRILARFQLAAAEAASGDKARAVAAYDELAADSSVEAILRDYARIRAAMLRVDDADMQEMQRRIGGLAVDNNPWRNAAHELLGLVAYRLGDEAAAETHFNSILSDAAASPGIRRRAEMMLALIVKADAAPTQ